MGGRGLRITGGSLRGRRVPVPPGEVRPTSERARQAYFNIVGERLRGARFLDLFAGSGIFAFEAVSRGAKSATAIEQSSKNCAAIEALAREFMVDVKPLPTDVLGGIKRLGDAVHDLVYADPPYDWPQYDDLLAALDTHAPLAAHALVAVEHRRNSEPFAYQPRKLRFARRAEYGEVWMSFFEADPLQGE
ncbi:MAG TPA: 16S rRNA (guanine(966)-N(2))-methyltransferase RsmD [Thermoanaerobaculia bacterium]|jgi:16S rRNA (guanine966-N2)-methyltransferase|nr:16S rRNA (guanine(966)-N(2))-methyltransferase RsmD [Thermoanaerobaculia bacterium]